MISHLRKEDFFLILDQFLNRKMMFLFNTKIKE